MKVPSLLSDPFLLLTGAQPIRRSEGARDSQPPESREPVWTRAALGWEAGMRGRGRGAEPGRRGAEGRGAGRVGGRARWEGGEPRGGGFPSPQPGRRRGCCRRCVCRTPGRRLRSRAPRAHGALTNNLGSRRSQGPHVLSPSAEAETEQTSRSSLIKPGHTSTEKTKRL